MKEYPTPRHDRVNKELWTQFSNKHFLHIKKVFNDNLNIGKTVITARGTLMKLTMITSNGNGLLKPVQGGAPVWMNLSLVRSFFDVFHYIFINQIDPTKIFKFTEKDWNLIYSIYRAEVRRTFPTNGFPPEYFDRN